MRLIEKQEFKQQKEFFLEETNKGKIFIYGTDTIYGIGCDATNTDAVKKVRNIKGQHTRPLSVIAPGKEWIRQNCKINGKIEEWLNKLPGPYTLILELKNPKNTVCEQTNPETDSLGVRIPKHWFSEMVEELGLPFITTSINKTGQTPITSLKELDTEIMEGIDYFINEGTIKGTPSTIVNLLDKEKIIKRK